MLFGLSYHRGSPFETFTDYLSLPTESFAKHLLLFVSCQRIIELKSPNFTTLSKEFSKV